MQAAQKRKFRGKNKAPKWTKPDDGIVSVMVLPLAVTDPADLARVEKLFSALLHGRTVFRSRRTAATGFRPTTGSSTFGRLSTPPRWRSTAATAPARWHREIIAKHGAVLVAEDCDIRTWYRLWGKRLSQTTRCMLISALDVECRAAGGRLVRASTWSTVLSQHCLCGERVTKTLRDRDHKCIACCLVGKRDLVSAARPPSSASQTRTTPRPRTWTLSCPGTHRSFVQKRWKKRCGSQPHRTRNRPGGRVAWQFHGRP